MMQPLMTRQDKHLFFSVVLFKSTEQRKHGVIPECELKAIQASLVSFSVTQRLNKELTGSALLNTTTITA